jgi:hypothetical protein
MPMDGFFTLQKPKTIQRSFPTLLEIPIVKGNTKLSTGAFFQIKKGSAK